MTTLPGDRSHEHLRSFPPPETWDHHVARDARAHPRKVTREFMLIPTTCFNCESACGLLAHVAKDDLSVTKVEGNPVDRADAFAFQGLRSGPVAPGVLSNQRVHSPRTSSALYSTV